MTEPIIVNKIWYPLPRWIRFRYTYEKVIGIVYHWGCAWNAKLERMPTLQELWDYHKNGALNTQAYHAMIYRNEIWQTLEWERISGAVGLLKYIDYPEDIRKKMKYWPDCITINILLLEEDEEGNYHQDTIDNGILLGAFLSKRYDLEPPEQVYRHSDVTHKGTRQPGDPLFDPDQLPCPKYFVEHPEEFEQFKLRIKEQLIVG